ncbi:MAG: DUF4249 family protein [Saprospiraceae bacterium]|nr:DUF4249 family protein [Saprospiraceae bacterium]
MKLQITINLFLLTLSMIWFSACLDKIDLDIPSEYDNALVVQGGLVRVGDHAEISVQMRLISDEKGQSRVIRADKALVSNDKGQEVELTLNEEGFYVKSIKAGDGFNIDYGTAFGIYVKSFDGEEYQSTFKILKPTPEIEKIAFRSVTRQVVNNLNQLDSAEFVGLFVDTDVINPAGEKSLLKFDIINSYRYTDQLMGFPPNKVCYVTARADLKNVQLYDGKKALETKLTDFPVYEKRLDYVFSEGYVGTVVQQAIDQETFDYFTQVNELNNREGNIYESPAGRIITNIQNILHPEKKAYGYFYAVSQDTARIGFLPELVGSPARECPVPPSETTPCPVRSCCDCLTLKGASLHKPAFWPW